MSLVSVGSAVSVDNKLQLAGTAEAVNVTAETPLVNISNSEVSTTVTEDQIRQLPTLTRDPYDLVALAGNAAPTPCFGKNEDTCDQGTIRGAGFNINGTRSSATNIMLDGAANNDEFDATVGQDIPLDSVQEFSVITNNYSAQYGRAAGGHCQRHHEVGHEQVHGDRLRVLPERRTVGQHRRQRGERPPERQFKRHQPGYSFGGPVVRDKVHFFSSLEYIGVRSNDTEISWIPTPEFLAADLPGHPGLLQHLRPGCADQWAETDAQ